MSKLISKNLCFIILFFLFTSISLFVSPLRASEPSGKESVEGLNLIVIDAGHGGKDSGAVGRAGTMEKDIALALAKKLKERLKKKLGAKVILTRNNDEFWPLADRASFANKHKADLFISIHVNASPSRKSRGVETFFLSFDATDDEARKTAAFENDVISLEGTTDTAPIDDIKSILWDLTQTEAHHESALLAESIYSSLHKKMGGEFRGVKQAPFNVLIGATMPAVLVEVGFISNPKEEKKLQTNSTQNKLVNAITDGVVVFKEAIDRRGKSYASGEEYGKE